MTSRLTTGIAYESNPYPAVVPKEIFGLSHGLGRFLRSLVDPLREQHNVTQAGDTTFSWEDLNTLTTNQLYSLGSLGRFLHPQYGIITARYVQFTECLTGVWTGIPAGYINNLLGFDWQVTTDFSKVSVARMCAGFAAGYTIPTEGQFGWLIETGVNTQSMIFSGVSAPLFGTSVGWTANGVVTAVSADALGVVYNTQNIVSAGTNLWELPPASVLVRNRG